MSFVVGLVFTMYAFRSVISLLVSSFLLSVYNCIILVSRSEIF